MPNPKGQVYGKPVHHGINQLKNQRSLQAVAEERAGCRCQGLRVLNSYWVSQDSTYKFYEIIMVIPSTRPYVVILMYNGFVRPEPSTEKCAASPLLDVSPAVSERDTSSTRRRVALVVLHGRGTTPTR